MTCKLQGLFPTVLACLIAFNTSSLSGQTPGPSGVVQQQRGNSSYKNVSGRVVDEEGQPLPGVSVLLGGSSNTGTITDAEGRFSLRVPDDTKQRLRLSYLGFKTLEAAVSNFMDLRLQKTDGQLREVVVEGGYGLAQKRSDMVGSAFQVEAKQLEKLPPARIDNMLEGLVPGMTVSPNSDSEATVHSRYKTRVRGEGSLTAALEPLWIVDGVRIYTGDRTNQVPGANATISPLSYLNPEDIESITVLKDAASVSIYGADGSNGVILVTTKRGRSIRPSFTASLTTGITQINGSLAFRTLDASEYLTLARESYRNRFATTDPTMRFFPFQDNAGNTYTTTQTDWYEHFFQTGFQTQAALSYSGGNEAQRNYISFAYFDKDNSLRGNRQQRASLRINSDMRLHKRVRLSLRIASSLNRNNIFSPGQDYLSYLPIVSLYDAEGNLRLYNHIYIQDSEGKPALKREKFLNSIARREENEHYQRGFANNSNIGLQIELWQGMTFNSELGVDYQSIYESEYRAMSNWSGRNGEELLGYAYRNSPVFFSWNSVQRLNFNRNWGQHNVSALAGFEAQSRETTSTLAQGNTFANDHIREVSQAVNRWSSSSFNLTRKASFFGQASYNYNKRYYIAASTRRDGSSDFGEHVHWAQFWSLGASWNIHNEAFFRSESVKLLKLKASYGNAGNSRVGRLHARGLYAYGKTYDGRPASTMESISNKELSWESSYIANLGISLRLLDRIDIEFEAYDKVTKDLINKTGVSLATGNTSVDSNIGSLSNRGLELNIESQNIKTKSLLWTSSLNLSHTNNIILKLNAPRLGSTNIVWREGHDKNTLNVVRWAGVNPRNGEALWYDARGNITNTYDINNAVPYRSTAPLLTGGFNNRLSYRNLNLSVFMTFVIGGYSFSSFSSRYSSDGYSIMNSNQSVNQLDRWQQPGDLALSPRPYWGISTKSGMHSTRYLFSSTHLKIKNIALSYDLPKEIVKHIGLRQAQASLIVDNIAVFTPYDRAGRNSYRQSISGFPLETGYSLSLNLSF